MIWWDWNVWGWRSFLPYKIVSSLIILTTTASTNDILIKLKYSKYCMQHVSRLVQTITYALKRFETNWKMKQFQFVATTSFFIWFYLTIVSVEIENKLKLSSNSCFSQANFLTHFRMFWQNVLSPSVSIPECFCARLFEAIVRSNQSFQFFETFKPEI